MKISELIVMLTAVLANEGDMKVFAGDMKPMDAGHVDVCDSITENPDERKLYGDKYLHIGEW